VSVEASARCLAQLTWSFRGATPHQRCSGLLLARGNGLESRRISGLVLAGRTRSFRREDSFVNAGERVPSLARRGSSLEVPRRGQPQSAGCAAAGTCGATADLPLLGRMTTAGRPVHLHAVRRFVAETLGTGPGAAGTESTDTAVLLVSELVANSMTHSRSASDGGMVTVALFAIPGGIRAEVTDQGGATTPAVLRSGQELADHGRGLELVSALATRWGYRGGSAGVVTWFDLCDPTPAGPGKDCADGARRARDHDGGATAGVSAAMSTAAASTSGSGGTPGHSSRSESLT